MYSPDEEEYTVKAKKTCKPVINKSSSKGSIKASFNMTKQRHFSLTNETMLNGTS